MEKLKHFYMKYLHHSLVLSVVLAFAINLAVESMARHSLIAGLKFFVSSPAVFLLNCCIIFATLSIPMLFRRRWFFYVFIGSLWVTLGIINGMILTNRMTPFTTKDLSVFSDGLSIVTNYLSKFQIALCIAGLAVIVAVFVLLFIFAPKKKIGVNYKRNLILFLVVVLGTGGVWQLAVKTKTVDTYFMNLAYAYESYGVPYCFISTWLDTGINKPDDYSKKAVTSIIREDKLGTGDIYKRIQKSNNGKKTNIIMLQLESFIDPMAISGYQYSEDPIPYFRSLLKNYSSGYLTVPAVGAGTANTEFEALTGISVKFFGPGEYPYKAVLKKKTCESIPFDLADLGYSSHAIHNHRGAFYNRNTAFANLGFDTFTSLEYMNNVVKTPKGWAKDDILIEQMTDALKSTKGQDFIYTISVQGHGKYPTEKVIENPAITVTKAPSESLKWQYEYYVNQVHEMDAFVKNLTSVLESYDEDVVLVMYGDHIPALEISQDQLKSKNLYNTQYVIWSNFKMEKQDKDLTAYQIGSEVLKRVGISEGMITKYNQTCKNTKNYLADLKMLAYDVLYGKDYAYAGKSPFKKSNLKMGVKDIKVDKIVKIGDKYYIKGQNFTEYSKISLDGKILDTVYLGPTILGLEEKVDPSQVSKMKISQVEKYNEILSTTE